MISTLQSSKFFEFEVGYANKILMCGFRFWDDIWSLNQLYK